MVFGYYGTPSYNSFNNLNYIRFLVAVDAIATDNIARDTKWSLGLLGYPLLSTFTCEKYVLTDNASDYETLGPYELIRTYGKISVFRNRLSLPFGLTFKRWFPEEQFLQLSRADKAEGLLHVVVLSDEKAANEYGVPELTLDELNRNLKDIPPEEQIGRLQAGAFDMHSFRETQIEGSVRADGKSILLFQMPFDPGWRVSVDDRATSPLRVDAGLLGVVLESGQHNVKLHYVPAFLGIGTPITIGCLVIFVLLFWKRPRLALVV
jgi:uncharacterized membrane protein YfhO